jgi:hypothetical protein
MDKILIREVASGAEGSPAGQPLPIFTSLCIVALVETPEIENSLQGNAGV